MNVKTIGAIGFILLCVILAAVCIIAYWLIASWIVDDTMKATGIWAFIIKGVLFLITISVVAALNKVNGRK